jgi:hypothetical protein
MRTEPVRIAWESFTFGLDRLLDGIAVYIARHRS